MATEAMAQESCGPQPLPQGEPTAKWTTEQLTTYAQTQDKLIVEAEKPLAVLYWRLGKALTFARDKYNHGSWGKFLESLGIGKTRASKAQAIYKSHRSEKDVAGLSVDRAYQERNRKKRQAAQADADRYASPGVIRSFLRVLGIELEKLPEVVAALSPPEAKELERDMDNTIRLFEELRGLLRSRAQEASGPGQPHVAEADRT